MCTKYFNDGDVHKYFNPYDSPYDSYINFMNILNDIIMRIKKNIYENNIATELRGIYHHEKKMHHEVTDRPSLSMKELMPRIG